MHTVDSIQSGSTVDGHGTLCGGQMSCVNVPNDVSHSPTHSTTYHIQPHTYSQNVSHSSHDRYITHTHTPNGNRTLDRVTGSASSIFSVMPCLECFSWSGLPSPAHTYRSLPTGLFSSGYMYTQPWPRYWGEGLPSCPPEGTLSRPPRVLRRGH